VVAVREGGCGGSCCCCVGSLRCELRPGCAHATCLADMKQESIHKSTRSHRHIHARTRTHARTHAHTHTHTDTSARFNSCTYTPTPRLSPSRTCRPASWQSRRCSSRHGWPTCGSGRATRRTPPPRLPHSAAAARRTGARSRPSPGGIRGCRYRIGGKRGCESDVTMMRPRRRGGGGCGGKVSGAARARGGWLRGCRWAGHCPRGAPPGSGRGARGCLRGVGAGGGASGGGESHDRVAIMSSVVAV
jgi:hypothetical protein